VQETPSRRERLRSLTKQEAKDLALSQLADGGPAALSLNAIAREMGFSGPALYRYFSGVEELLSELIFDAFNDLANAIEVAAALAKRRSPAERFIALSKAYREWALRQPHRYLLLFGTPLPGYHAPAESVIAAKRRWLPFVEVISQLIPPKRRKASDADMFSTDPGWFEPLDVAPVVSEAVLRTWTRLHGVVSLEIEGHFTGMGFDPGALYALEVGKLLEQLTTGT
jgi:AcrR family transcriptional regulator